MWHFKEPSLLKGHECRAYRSKFAALHRQLWRLHMSEKLSSGMIHSKQTNKQKFMSGMYGISLLWIPEAIWIQYFKMLLESPLIVKGILSLEVSNSVMHRSWYHVNVTISLTEEIIKAQGLNSRLNNTTQLHCQSHNSCTLGSDKLALKSYVVPYNYHHIDEVECL